MHVKIREETADTLAEYGAVSIAFEISRVFDVEPGEAAGERFVLRERVLGDPIAKDYDADPGNPPADWPAHFDVANWGFLSAWVSERRVGGAAIAFRSPSLEMLEGRNDLAVLWDIRIAPAARGQGIGASLLAAAERWARKRGARWLKVETQNINVQACRFYARHGFVLTAADPFAYAAYPEEIQLLWYKDLCQ